MDWILSGLVLSGNYLLGKKNVWGWYVMAVNSIGWIIYAFMFDNIQWGLVPSAAINFVLCIKGVYEWRHGEKPI
jgi:hypothetical protein